MIKIKKTVLLMLCTICFQLSATAQRITQQYNNVSFTAALKNLKATQNKYPIKTIYFINILTITCCSKDWQQYYAYFLLCISFL